MKKSIIIIAVLILSIGGGIYYMNLPKEVEADVKEAEIGSVEAYIEDIATVVSEETRIVKSKMAGEIKNFNFEMGDKINKEDFIISFDKSDVELQIAGIETEIARVEAAYREAVKPNDYRLIQKAKSALNLANINLEEAQKDEAKMKSLYEEGASTLSEYDKTKANTKLMQEQVKIAQNEYSLLQKRVSNDVRQQYEKQIEVLKNNIKQIKNNLDDFELKSPASGTITQKYVENGDIVAAGTPIMEITDLEDLHLECDVLVEEISNIEVGTRVLIDDEDVGVIAVGEVSKIHPKAFTKISDLGIEQKRIKVEIEIDDYSSLKPGYELEVNFVEAVARGAVIVEKSAVFDYEESSAVFIVEDKKAKLVEVETGVEGDEYIEIIDGIEEGDFVIISPNEEIEEGINIKFDEEDNKEEHEEEDEHDDDEDDDDKDDDEDEHDDDKDDDEDEHDDDEDDDDKDDDEDEHDDDD